MNLIEAFSKLDELYEDVAEEEVVVEEEVPEEEEIPKEDANTVEEFLKSVGEYSGKLALEFKPIVIDGKEYTITGLLWDDSEEGKLVGEVVINEPEVEEEEAVVEEEEAVAEEGEELPEESEEPIEEDVNGPRAAAVDPESIDPNEMCSVVLVDGGAQVYTGTYNECAEWLATGGCKKFGGPSKLMVKLGAHANNIKESYRRRFVESTEPSAVKTELENLIGKYSKDPLVFYTAGEKKGVGKGEIMVMATAPYSNSWGTHQKLCKLIKEAGFELVEDYYDYLTDTQYSKSEDRDVANIGDVSRLYFTVKIEKPVAKKDKFSDLKAAITELLGKYSTARPIAFSTLEDSYRDYLESDDLMVHIYCNDPDSMCKKAEKLLQQAGYTVVKEHTYADYSFRQNVPSRADVVVKLK